MARKHLKLQHSESIVAQGACQIYAAYIASGRVVEGEEAQWMQRAIREATTIAVATDDHIVSDGEVDTEELERQGGITAGRTRSTRGRHDA